MMKFHLHADCTFEAESIDEALRRIAENIGSEEAWFVGYLECQPACQHGIKLGRMYICDERICMGCGEVMRDE